MADLGRAAIKPWGGAEFERKLMGAHCYEGIKRAKARGTVFGCRARASAIVVAPRS